LPVPPCPLLLQEVHERPKYLIVEDRYLYSFYA
jgi:hypothetical protein